MAGTLLIHQVIVSVVKKLTLITYILNCKSGGYVSLRHNRLRDLEAEFMREVCHDVKVEPDLLHLENEQTRGGNVSERARLDVSGVGVWGSYEKTYLDIKVHASQFSNIPEQIYSTTLRNA